MTKIPMSDQIAQRIMEHFQNEHGGKLLQSVLQDGMRKVVTEINQYAWYTDNSNGKTLPVGQKLPNAWSLHDMSGNVWKWCEDWYHESYSGAPTDGCAWVSPSGSFRVRRGGSWLLVADYCRSAYRYCLGPDDGYSFLGFRLARSVR